MKIWICDGIPKDGKSYPNCSGVHPQHENYIPNCEKCGLPREAVVISKRGINRWLIFAGVGIFLLIGGAKIIASFLDSKTILPPPCTTPPCYYRSFAEVPNVPSGPIYYGGSTTFAPLRSPQIVQLIRQAHPGYNLIYREPPAGRKPGSGIGIKMLLEGQLSFAASSRPLETSEIQEAQKRSFQLEQIPIAIDGIAFYTHPQLLISGLTIPQLKDILTGKITNWKEVNGPNLAITIFSRSLSDGGTPKYLQEEVLGKEKFTSAIQEVRDTTTGIQKVGSIPGSIGYATASEVCNQPIASLSLARDLNQPLVAACIGKEVNKTAFKDNSYPITRRIFIVIKRSNSPENKIDEQAGVAYVNLILSDEGQQVVEKAGFVPIRK
ncbi:PstS family phosphate ABC transporter substrate-binding protein [Floridanema evergladense]|uniref:PstS family phosphate ABC transporter substrate-binding protein n=1 Tax=Floridaenema evergladense BLCC-F167 TaxID=3153639 RepID=A0ABV4WS24_9CYAN